MSKLSRRDALKAGLATGAALVTPAIAMKTESTQTGKFKLKYAPHFGMFQNSAGGDPIDQLKYASDHGFTAWEDNGMKGRPVEEQTRIAKTMTQLGMTMGVFVASPDTAWGSDIPRGKHDQFLEECKSSVDVAKRVNAKWMTVVPGSIENRMDMGYQTANVIEALRKASAIFEPHGLVMVIEALNFRDHPNMLLNKMAQGYMICRAVNSPSCKLLVDMYHHQIHEGNIIPNLDLAWSEIGCFQIGDNPGRNEPLTGEMNYHAIFKHINEKGYKGVLGMEHGNSKGGKEGEAAVISAYRTCDNF